MSSLLERVPAVSCLSIRCFKISKCVSFTYGLGSLQTDVFALDPRVNESPCNPLRIGFSNLYISDFPRCYHHWFSKPSILQVCLCRIWGFEMPDVEHKALALREKFHIFEIPHKCGLMYLGLIVVVICACMCVCYFCAHVDACVCVWDHFSASPTHLDAVLLSLVVEALFSDLFQRKLLHIYL